ncbi:PLP-dependent aminotransferase family protein [Bacillus manliponensis]|uniref:MocR-like pyridoxine biosynthesis transcription factor PdxR n=1 Tax=Bacillus manliponensis TaxID=574376 RepID=UPI0035176B15
MELTISLQTTSKIPLYMQIYQHIQQEIWNGNIKVGSRLPSHRNLSLQLGVSRNTVECAYQQLIAEGYAESKPKRGLFVSHVDYSVQQNENNAGQTTIVPMPTETFRYDFHHGSIDTDSFPLSTWRKIMSHSFLQYESELFTNEDPQGEWQLRNEISQYLYKARGVCSTPNQIIIGAGTQQLLSLLIQLFPNHYKYGMENPGFHRVRAVLESYNLPIHPISLHDKGICITDLYKSEANIVYVTPSHQFPFGMIMPLSERMKLLKWANETQGYIIEDDYDGEFRYVGKPIPSLQGLDRNNRVIYAGTFSKSFLPSIRMSYLVLPSDLLRIYKERGIIIKQTVPKIQQLAFSEFMKQGYWERHLNRIRTVYKRKHQRLISAIEDELGQFVRIIGAQSGLHIVLQVHNGMTEKELIQSSAKKNVKVYPLSLYDITGHLQKESYVLLGFGGIQEDEISNAITLLKEAWS